MSFRIRSTVAVTVLTSAIVAGCSANNRIAQCNRLIEVANQAVNQVETVTQNFAPEEVEALEEIANTTDQAANSLESVSLDDEQLQRYQNRFVSLYIETSQATRSLVSAVEQQNTNAAQEAYNALETATNQEGPLVNEINTYCRSEDAAG